jgi:hypothetical protein
VHALAIDQAEPGVVLAEDVVDRHGRPLLRAGNELTARSIQSLRMWGVRSICVQGDAPDDPTEEELLDPEVRAAAETMVGERFALVGTADLHPFLEALRQEALSDSIRTVARRRR